MAAKPVILQFLQIADQNVSPNPANPSAFAKSDFWTDARVDYLKWRRAEGASQKKITVELGLPEGRVGTVAGKLERFPIRLTFFFSAGNALTF